MKTSDDFGKLQKLLGDKVGKLCRYNEQELESISKPIDSGILPIDLGVLQIGGLPRGRVVEIFGRESSGKSTLAKKFIKGAQKQGLSVILIDAERADRGESGKLWMKKCGVDIDDPNFTYLAESNLDTIGPILVKAIKYCNYKFCVIDSVASLYVSSSAEDHESGKKKFSDAEIAIEARALTKLLRELNALADDYGATILFVNQARPVIGGYGRGITYTTPGGTALKFYASIRLLVDRKGQVKVKDEIVGSLCKVHVFKNKVSRPFLTTEVIIRFDGMEFDSTEWMINAAINAGYIKKSAKTYTYVIDSGTGEVDSVVGINNLKTIYQTNERLNRQLKEWIEQNKDKLLAVEEVDENADSYSADEEKDVNLAVLSLEE